MERGCAAAHPRLHIHRLRADRGDLHGFALVLAARTWVKLNEPRLLATRGESLEGRLRREQLELERAAREPAGEGSGDPEGAAGRPIGAVRREAAGNGDRGRR
jgi:hypothetical protein